MFRKPVRPNPSRTPRALTVQIAAPIKGWASEDSPVDAEEGTALVLDNWFPDAESLRLRRGYAEHATGMTGDIETLIVYTGASTSKMFAANGGSIYDVTSAGAVGAAAISGLTNDRWQYTMFANSSGTPYLVMANGADDVRNYEGTTWSTPAITGVTSSTLIQPWVHKNRTWFTQINSSDVWFLGTNSLAGAATKFSLGGLLSLGGYIMAGGTWSVDSGTGMDDLLVAWSSEGEVIIYQGTDPTSSNTWALVGVYKTGRPIGRRCMFPVGGDLALLTEDGVLPISQLMKADRAVAGAKALTARIRQAYADSVQRARTVFGWQMISHPTNNMAILNVPASSSDPVYQFALNTITGAWARFKGMAANCWAVLDDEIYFGSTDGKVYMADSGGTDNGGTISAVCLPAYMHLSARGRLKHVKMVQPIYSTDVTAPGPSVSIAVDYELPVDIAAGEVAEGSWFTWDVSEWDGPDLWFGYAVTADWSGSGNIGTVVSPYTTVTLDASGAATDFRYRLTGWGIVYETGGIL